MGHNDIINLVCEVVLGRHLSLADETRLREMLRTLEQDAKDEQFDNLRKLYLAAERIPQDRLDGVRSDFLDGLITGAIESGSAGNWMDVMHYDFEKPQETSLFENPNDIGPGDAEYGKLILYVITHEVIERGLRLARNATPTKTEFGHTWTTVQGLTEGLRQAIVWADLTNEDDLDVVGYLAILEMGLFGEVRYG